MARHVILSIQVRILSSKKLDVWLKGKPSQDDFALLSLMSKVYVLDINRDYILMRSIKAIFIISG